MIILGCDPSWKQHPDSKVVWVSPSGQVFKQINQRHPERRQWLEYKQDVDKDGYESTRVEGKKWLTHRLVYLLFVGPLLPDLVVCHRDNNRSHNHWRNLLQATQKENISHKVLHGTHQAGEKHPQAIHTRAQIESARTSLSQARLSLTGRLKKGEAIRISKETGVSLHTVRDLSSKQGIWV